LSVGYLWRPAGPCVKGCAKDSLGRGRRPLLLSAKVEALPTEPAGIDGPHSWTQQSQGGAQGSHEDPAAWVIGRGQIPERVGQNEHSRDRGPQPNQQNSRQHGGDRGQHGCSDRRTTAQRGRCIDKQCDTSRQAHQQKAGTRRAVGERGEQSAHSDRRYGRPPPAESLERVRSIYLFRWARTR